jgi:hypothetical protein
MTHETADKRREERRGEEGRGGEKRREEERREEKKDQTCKQSRQIMCSSGEKMKKNLKKN